MRMHRQENHHHRHRRGSNSNIGLQSPQDRTQEEISSPSSPSPPATPSSAQFMHPRKAFVLQYNASLLQLQSQSS